MNVSIPDGLRKWVEHRVAEGRYASTSDYLRDLIRRDEEHGADRAWLQAELDAGRQSGMDLREPAMIIEDVIAAQNVNG